MNRNQAINGYIKDFEQIFFFIIDCRDEILSIEAIIQS